MEVNGEIREVTHSEMKTGRRLIQNYEVVKTPTFAQCVVVRFVLVEKCT